MQNFVLGYLKDRYGLEDTIIKAWVIHTISKGESSIDEIIGEFETLKNPTVGLLAHPGQTDIRVTAKASSSTEAELMMQPVLQTIRERLGKYIYGENGTTIAEAVANLILTHNLHVSIIESGTNGEILESLQNHIPDRVSGQSMDVSMSNETLKTLMHEYQSQLKSNLVLGVRLNSNGEKQDLFLVLMDNEIIKEGERSYGGPIGDAQIWAMNSALDFIRRQLINN